MCRFPMTSNKISQLVPDLLNSWTFHVSGNPHWGKCRRNVERVQSKLNSNTLQFSKTTLIRTSLANSDTKYIKKYKINQKCNQ